MGYKDFISGIVFSRANHDVPLMPADSSSSTIHSDKSSSFLRTRRENSTLAEEKIFSSALKDSILDGIGNALGESVLRILLDRRLLDNGSDANDFHRQLYSLFGNGAIVLEKIVVKDLYRRLNIPYNSHALFDYEEALETAKEVCFVEGRLR